MQLVVVQLLRVQRHVLCADAYALCCCRGGWSVSSLNCSARFIFFMEDTGMSETSERAPTLLTEASRSPGPANFGVKTTGRLGKSAAEKNHAQKIANAFPLLTLHAVTVARARVVPTCASSSVCLWLCALRAASAVGAQASLRKDSMLVQIIS